MTGISFRPSVRGDITYSQLEDGAMIYDPRTDRVHTLNLSAASIWDLCDGSRTLDLIATELSKITGESLEKLRLDVEKMVIRFRDENLLVEE